LYPLRPLRETKISQRRYDAKGSPDVPYMSYVVQIFFTQRHRERGGIIEGEDAFFTIGHLLIEIWDWELELKG
jgi:hypothetical protein